MNKIISFISDSYRNRPIILVALAAVLYFLLRYILTSVKTVDLFKTFKVLSKEQANVYAQMLYSAMNQAGTDEQAINEVYLAIRDVPGAFSDVCTAFGSRKYLMFAYSSIGEPLDLVGWLGKEVDSDTFNKFSKLLM